MAVAHRGSRVLVGFWVLGSEVRVWKSVLHVAKVQFHRPFAPNGHCPLPETLNPKP